MNTIQSIGQRQARRIERSRWASDMNNVSDATDRLSKLLAEVSEAMQETRDGSVESQLSVVWEELNATHGKLIKLRGILETA